MVGLIFRARLSARRCEEKTKQRMSEHMQSSFHSLHCNSAHNLELAFRTSRTEVQKILYVSLGGEPYLDLSILRIL